MNELEAALEGTPVRWQCKSDGGEWVSITKRRYEELIGNWDYELRTVNVVSQKEKP